MTDEPTAPEEPESPASRLADLVLNKWAAAKAAMTPGEHTARLSANTDLMEQMERDLSPMMEKLWRPLIDSGALPDEWREVFEYVINPEHQTGLFVQILSWVGFLLEILPAVGKPAVQSMANTAWQQHVSMPLAAPDAADAVIRGVLDNATAQDWATKTGYGSDAFSTMIAITGEPPGPVDMLKLWLRGAITEPFLEHAIRYSRIRDEFIQSVKDLAYSQMTPADALEVAIKGVVPHAEAHDLFVRGGGLETDFETLFQATGDSIGTQEVLTLYHFGLATDAEVNATLARSRLNPMFYDLAKRTHFHPLPPFQVVRALTSGTITPAQAETWLMQYGIPADQAHALSQSHGTTGTSKVHAETETLVRDAYEEQILTRPAALQSLEQIGYHPDVANLILEVADAKRANAQQNHAVSVVRANYVARRIDRTQATDDLNALQVPPDARNKWLIDWDLEIAAHPKQLTAVQLADAGKDGFLPPADVYHRIVGLGYTAGDAKVLMQLHKAPLPAGV